MHHVDLVMGEDGLEEIEKGGNQTRPQGVGEIMNLSDYPVTGEVRRRPGRRPPTLVEDGGQSRAELIQALSIEYDRPADGGGHRRRRTRWRHGFLPFLLLRRSHGDGKEGEDVRWDWRQESEFEGRKNRGRSSNRKGSGCAQLRVHLAERKIRERGGTVPLTSNQLPRGAQGRRLLGPAALRPCPFASRHDQVHARLGPGGYYRRSRNGGPQTCLPAACGVARRGPSTAHLHQHKTQDPREGPSLTGRTTRHFLRHCLIRLAH